ncbi:MULTISPECIES: M23 family metallopeptidase [unclassified Cryobacterium]|uniref:M23 family metallopeptidase n=1 Tax=unclassified Cryobacterium TaxID=2649013 RepID=UPI00106C7BF2|nr:MULTISPECIES: M23 family metallopeptidase [unclassified Cryobacterium]MDY7529909.1 peptidoglycan DD-metalloendopeptidase family protein [Cryobacterium sp. 10C2]MDY7557955.1 peptidoglycan DD-metalloendopeptidase family protein [Cryobacterium sp. 10C3]MEB0002887.1 peptidoglycan DD-metalloendopeptidase family protein [Cryobacterium sp. RTC2.1]MEB0202604.1 peptidoglycan DD-metalloendopeptidase family protein [Cryobacterium sp. 5I3]MEB0287859.1 peptidoglycan DD-metalloendopeptidase family protei
MRKAVTSDRGASEQSGPLRPAGGRRVHSHRGLFRGTAATALATALALIVTLVIPAGGAQAVDYPSWQDVQNAKSNTAAASAKVTEIQNLISNLQTQVAQTQAESEKRGAELQVAQQNYDDATRRASDLQAQADTSKATADAATKQAGQLAAQLYRTGGTDLTVNLFLDGDASGQGADALLAKLGSMSKMVERSTGVYEEAQAATNSAQALGDQAKIAQTERETLNVAAQAAMVAAQAAAEAAASALAESESKSVELAAQLAFMQDAQASTTAGYEAGVAERARLAAIEAARAAAAAAAAAAANRGNSSGGATGSAGAGLGGGYISSQGWAVPASGRITDGFGPRASICGSTGCSGTFHYGTDLGASCGAPIYAAHDGVVEYAGPNGTYGNYIQINNGGGISTGYAHIRPGGIFVSNGQSVSAGQNIGSVGMTGAADGCHLHFEVRINGVKSNAVPFMASKGAPLG